MSTNSIPTLGQFTIQSTTTTTELYDSLFQILSLLSSQQTLDLPFDSMTKYNLLMKSSTGTSNEILQDIEHNLIYSQSDYSGSLETIKSLVSVIGDIKQLNNVSYKSVNSLLLSSVNSSRSSTSSFHLEFNNYGAEADEEDGSLDFDALYRHASDSLMRIKLDLINWDTETECDQSLSTTEKFASFPTGDDLFELELEL
ncbi:hypothetical protein WICPIJ_006203 [Wickerhamomyces pijperi]|uniref:Uncharacterized protein n=1 Tax=Wickerhamomyces pijperi TaxID=599730 RepID=A0A9P8Q245_WICPI|nr:hypothetical protein WICPIJ_006203 [Wickerhamomyces pijperi]